MTDEMDHGALRWALHDVVDGLQPRLPGGDSAAISEYVDHNELGLAIGSLIDVLLLERVAVTPDEHERLRDLLTWFREAGSRTSVVLDMDAILGALDRTDRTGSHRGLPPLRGGHLRGSGRPGATEFPAGWNAERIGTAADGVAGPPVILANGKVWNDGEVHGVRVGVLVGGDGARRSVVPLPGQGVARTPLTTRSLPQRLALGVQQSGAAVIRGLPSLIDRQEVRSLKALLDTGEWDELADAIAARLAVLRGGAPSSVLSRARVMLLAFDLPVEGCAFLNDRDAVLARWEAV